MSHGIGNENWSGTKLDTSGFVSPKAREKWLLGDEEEKVTVPKDQGRNRRTCRRSRPWSCINR